MPQSSPLTAGFLRPTAGGSGISTGGTQKPAIGSPRKGTFLHFARQAQRFVHSHPAQFGNKHWRSFDRELILREREAVVTVLLLNRRIVRHPGFCPALNAQL